MALWAPARHCCFCLQLSGATSCALWEGQTHFSRCGVTSPLLGWLHTHVLNRAWKNEDILGSFLFVATVSVPQRVSACPFIKRGRLANSVAAYYCNCMCTILHLMQAGFVNRKRLFVEQLGRCKPMLCSVARLQYKYHQHCDCTGFRLYLQTWSVFLSVPVFPVFEINDLKTNIFPASLCFYLQSLLG